MTKLSIIVPCYNSVGTLEEAVDSVFRQKLSTPFDVTLVDDGSIDKTHDIMEKLANKYPGIKLVRHKTNLGGGAARNTGVDNSDGEIIFCLDSDDLLSENTLENMITFWQEKKCDGVGISTSIKFNGIDVNDVERVDIFEGPGEKVRFESFLNPSLCSLNSTFLVTREAFYRINGYPIDHGFDSQGFAFRFLCNGLTAYTCPDAVYYHRINYHDNYYVREAKAGRVNWNWLKVLDEFIYIFNDSIKNQIYSNSLFEIEGKPHPAEMAGIVRGRKEIYGENYKELIQMGVDEVARKFQNSEDRFEQYWLGSYHLNNKDYRKALDHFSKALVNGFDYKIIHIKFLEVSLGLSGNKLPVRTLTQNLVSYFVTPDSTSYRKFLNQLKQIRLLRLPLKVLFWIANWSKNIWRFVNSIQKINIEEYKQKLLHNYHELNSLEKIKYFVVDRWRFTRSDRFFFEGFRSLRGQMYIKDREALFNTIKSLKPRYCFEVGDYTSEGNTFFLAKAFKQIGQGKLIFLDAEYSFHQVVNTYKTKLSELVPYVEFLYGVSPEQFLSYIKESDHQADCVFLFGSETTFEPQKHYHFFLEYLRPGSIMIIYQWHSETMKELKSIIESDDRWHLELILHEPYSVGFVVYSFQPHKNQ
ncbi:MAG: glycosyltransferase [Chloroflexi bacterium]|nr:glycosyltransferase [Chloroflexota bacterium]